MSTTSPIGTARVPSLIPMLNPLIRRLLGSGLAVGPSVLLTVRGRTSGVPRTFPVAIIELNGRRFVQSPFGEVNWVHNRRAAREAAVTRGRQNVEVDAIEVAPEEGGPVLRDALAPYRKSRLLSIVLRRFFNFRSGSTLAEYVAEAGRHPMFELRTRTAVKTAA